MIQVIDFGSTKVPHIVGMLKSLDQEVTVQQWSRIDASAIAEASAFVLSGSPIFLTEVDHQPYLTHCSFLKNVEVPVLGICYGHQIIGILHGAEIYRGPAIRRPETIRILQNDPLLKGFGKEIIMTEDHTEGINLPESFIHIATSDFYLNEGMKHETNKIWGIQFHPEVSGENGLQLFQNFCGFIAG